MLLFRTPLYRRHTGACSVCRTSFRRFFVVIDRAVNDLRIDRCWGWLLSWWCSLAICPLGGNYFGVHWYLGVRTLLITGNAPISIPHADC